MPRPIYLDYAAATPLDSGVLAAMQPYFIEKFFNPSATYATAQEIKHNLLKARTDVAQVIGSRPSEIVFTAGGTEANNLAIKGVMEQYPDAEMLVSSIEHESVLQPAARYNTKQIPVKPDGVINLDKLRSLISDKVVLISVMYANNEVGTIQPIRKLMQVVDAARKERRAAGNALPLLVHTDACQAGNYLDLHVSRLGVDMMTLNGGKIYGPKQVGALFVKAGVQMTPLIEGGGQERGVRSGTENVGAAVGFAAALRRAQSSRRENQAQMQGLQKHFINMLTVEIPGVAINGSQKHRLPNNVHITIPGQDNERLLFALDEKGIQAAAGSACSASNEEPSHVLRAMGVAEIDAQASLRFTMGNMTTKDDIEHTVRTFAGIVKNSVY